MTLTIHDGAINATLVELGSVVASGVVADGGGVVTSSVVASGIGGAASVSGSRGQASRG